MDNRPETTFLATEPLIYWAVRLVFLGGGILSFSGIAKVLTASGDSLALTARDPLFGISFHILLFLVGGLEIVGGLVCFLKLNLKLRLSLMAWFGANFLLYRVAARALGWRGICPCLGTLTDKFHISPALANGAMQLIAILLVATSLVALRLLRSVPQHSYGTMPSRS